MTTSFIPPIDKFIKKQAKSVGKRLIGKPALPATSSVTPPTIPLGVGLSEKDLKPKTPAGDTSTILTPKPTTPVRTSEEEITARKEEAVLKAEEKKKLKKKKRRGTILTGPRGLLAPIDTQRKTLLGE